MAITLFREKEYPVFIGNSASSVAVCVVWQGLELILRHFPWLKEKCVIVGNLRSPFGVNIIFYNLGLNPHIRRLYLWGPDRLSNTPIGVEGKNTLLALWKGEEYHGFRLVDEIKPQIRDTIRKNVELIDISNSPRLDEQTIKKPTSQNARSVPISIAPFIVKAPETFPSEQYTYPIRVSHGADGYLSLLTHVWRYGLKSTIDEEGEQVKEIRGVVVTVENEDPNSISLPDWLIEEPAMNISRESLETYYQTQFSPKPYRKEIMPGIYRFERPKDYSYLYAELIFAYPRPKEIDAAVFALYRTKGYTASQRYIISQSRLPNRVIKRIMKIIESSPTSQKRKLEACLEALIPPVDQVSRVVERIRRKPVDLDKEIFLWNPWYHSFLENGRPCICKISFSVRLGRIDMHVFVRSHDIARAWFYNFYGLTRLLGEIAKRTGYRAGRIIVESESAHIYRRDWETVKALVEKMVYAKDPRMYFDPGLDLDPRGVINIEVLGTSIKVKLQDTKTGNLLFETTGRTGRELLYKLKHFQLISRIDHGIFIGGELAKAEICIKLGIPYRYDSPIHLPHAENISS